MKIKNKLKKKTTTKNDKGFNDLDIQTHCNKNLLIIIIYKKIMLFGRFILNGNQM